MEIRKDQLLQIEHSRKGVFVAVATRDFDTEAEAFWPLAVAKGYIRGFSRDWAAGEAIPCRGRHVTRFEVLES